MRGILLTLAKYALALGLLYWAFRQADSERIVHALQQMHPAAFLISLLALALAQIISAYRMRHYFQSGGLPLSPQYCIMLYYVGMLYNNILPGGIGGDGYKVLVVKRRYGFSAKRAVALLVSERANGLLVLLFILYGFVLASAIPSLIPYGSVLVGLLAALTVPCYVLGVRILFKEHWRVGAKAALYSTPAQACSVLAGASLMVGMGVQGNYAEFLAVFLFASVLSAVLPISVGGMGVRELTFLYAGDYLPIVPEQGIAFALVYFAVYFLCSLVGVAFLHKVKTQKEASDGST